MHEEVLLTLDSAQDLPHHEEKPSSRNSVVSTTPVPSTLSARIVETDLLGAVYGRLAALVYSKSFV